MVATTTDLASLVAAVGGERVEVVSLVAPTANPEDYQPRPRDLERLRIADAVIRVGLDFDLWLDKLLAQTGRGELRRSGARHIDGSRGVALLEIQAGGLGNHDGHAHGTGNPHYWLDPQNAAIITGSILEALVRLDPAHARAHEARRIRFLDQLESKLPAWHQQLAEVEARALIAHHNTWAYFARRFRLRFVGTIELREGVPPTAGHLAKLVAIGQKEKVALIIRQPHEPAKDGEFLANRIGAKVLVLAASIGAVPAAHDYFALFDHNIALLARPPERPVSTKTQ